MSSQLTLNTVLLSTTYLGPIQYYSKFVSYDKIVLEKFEHFPKQTYRNRCIIYSANGLLTISIPVCRGPELKIYTKDVRIDYSMNWQKIHFKAIESAYRCSPFYEFYIDEYISFYEKKYEFLFDFNMEIIYKSLAILGIPKTIETSPSYTQEVSVNCLDFRDSIHPKKRMFVADPSFDPPSYHQVFETKYDFKENLSIIDLIFNTGPEAVNHLRQSILR